MPVLAICGQAETTVRGGSYQQELNLDRMFADVAEYVQEVAHPAQLPHVIDRAIRLAIARRGPSVIIIPKDVQEEAFETPKRAHGFTRSGPGYSRPVVVPAEADLRKAAEVLNAGEKVAILIGAGAADAADEVDRRRRDARRRRRQGAARQVGAARRPAFVTGCDRPARHQAELRLDERLRHLADGRHRLPLVGIPAQDRRGARGADRHRSGDAVAALPVRGQPARQRRRDPPAAPADARTKAGPLLAERDPGRNEATGGRRSNPGRKPRPTRSIRSAWCGKCPLACPTMRSSPATAAHAPIGMRATIG